MKALVLLTAIAVNFAGLPFVASAAPNSPGSMKAAEQVDAAERPDSVSAMVTARAVGHRVEDVSQRSETTQVFANPGGTWTSEAATDPVRAQDEQGAWSEIDTTLVAVPGGFAPKSAIGHLLVSDGGDKTFAALEVDETDLGWRWPTVLPAPVIEGPTATYADVVENGDLVVTATASGFRHDIVLRQAPTGPVSYKIPVVTGGPVLSEDTSGELAITTQGGEELVSAPAPVMYDSSVDVVGDPENVVPVQTSVTRTATGGVLTLSPDPGFLADPDTVWPVVIDPTYTSYPSGDTWIDSSSPSAIHPNDDDLRVGTDAGGTYRALLQFGNGPWLDKRVTSASLIMRNFDAPVCNSAISTRTNRITTAWAPGSVKWSAQPGATSTGADDTAGSRTGSATCAAADMSWTITSIVQGWADRSFPNYGLRVNSVTEGNNHSYRAYRSASFLPAGTNPRLTVSYNSYPGVPTAVGMSPFVNAMTSSLTPTFTAKVTDPDASTVKAHFKVYSGSTQIYYGNGTTVASGGTSTLKIPAGELANGAAYTLKVFGYDGAVYSGNGGAAGAVSVPFTVDTTKPAAAVTASAYNAGQWLDEKPAANTFTLNGDADVKSFTITQDSAPTTVTANSAGDASVAWNPGSGGHTFTAAPVDRAGNTGETVTFGFGNGSAALDLPIRDDRSSSTFPVQASAPPGATSAKVQWRFAPEVPDPNTGWTDATGLDKASDGSPWSGSVATDASGGSATPALVWDPHQETGLSSMSALVEVRVVFAYAGSVVKSSPLQRVQVVPHAFGGSFPTDSAGPGQVALFTGEFQMSQTDVSVPGYGGALTLGRSHLSMAAAPAGPVGVFGPGWKADLAGPEKGVSGFSVVDRTEDDGSIMLLSPEGDAYTYRHSDGTRGAQEAGDYVGVGEAELAEDNLTLAAVTGQGDVTHRLTLSEWDGTQTIFLRTNGVWSPDKVVSAEDNSTTRYEHDGEGSVTWIFAPAPAGVVCDAHSQQPGCRALHLNHTVTGSGKRLTSVDLRIYDPDTGTNGEPGSGAGMKTIPVAKYAYNGAGQLEAAWDPRLGDDSAALKTQYTYAEVEGHTALKTLTDPGLKPWTFNYPGGRLGSITRVQDESVGGDAATWTIGYNLDLSGSGLPDLTAENTNKWGQPSADAPIAGAAVFGPDHAAGSDYEYASLSYWTKSGRVTNSAVFGAGAWQIGSQRYDEKGNTIWALDAAGRNQALKEGTTSEETAAAASKYAAWTVYNDDGSRVEETYSPTHDFVLKDGTAFTGRALTETVYDGETEAAGFMQGRPTDEVPAGGFDLPVRRFTSATDKATPTTESQRHDLEETRYRYDKIQSGDGDGWLLKTPTRVSTQDGSGWSTTSTRFDTEGKVTETRTPESNDSTGRAATARTMQNHYYTANADAARDECDNRPQWAGEMCWHGTEEQPATGDPIPDTTTIGYSTLLAPTKAVEASGATIRTNVAAYDAAGRPTNTSLTTSGPGAPDRAVPAVTTTYSATTGAATNISNGTQTQTAGYDTWGRVTSQTDGTGNTATTSYDAAGRVATANDGKGTYTYTYNGLDSKQRKERRGLVTKLDVGLASGLDEFTGAYNDDGALIEQNYPGGVQATWDRDLTGAPTDLTYTQGGTDLLAFTQILDQSGRVREASGPSSDRSYRYDDRDRLTKVEDTAGNSCTTRVYDFSKDSNRKSLATHAPSIVAGSEGQCQTETAANTETSSFDDADRITGTGYTYDPLGRTMTVPGSDTTTPLGSPSDLAVDYHANDMVATLSQSGTEGGASVTKSQDFSLDAGGRISVIKNITGGVSLEESTNHYANGGDSPAWTQTKKRPDAAVDWENTWTRNIASLGGDLGIIQASDGTSELQLSNLHGDVVSSIGVSGVGIDSYSETDEYGIPGGAPSATTRYRWLGAKQRQSAGVLGGLALMGVRLFNPLSGRFLSRDPVEGGNDNSYIYPADPVNQTDLTGKWCVAGIGTTCTRYITDRYGRTVPIRHEKRKKYQAHNLVYTIVKYTIKHGSQRAAQGSSVNLEYTFPKVVCRYTLFGKKCHEPGEKATVRVVVDFRKYGKDGKTLGLVTAYCPGYGQRCPDWLRKPA